MKRLVLSALLLLVAFTAAAQVDFDKYFEDKTVNLEYLRVGCKQWDTIRARYFDSNKGATFILTNHVWAGSKTNLIDPFNNGNYCVEVREHATGRLLYSRGFNSLFQEYCDTPQGDTAMDEYQEVVQFPKPKIDVDIVLCKRDKNLKLQDQKSFAFSADKASIKISDDGITEREPEKVHVCGDPHEKLDIVIVGQDYGNDTEKFKKDLAMFADNLFEVEPFKRNKENINIWGKCGEVGAEYNTFDADRYCMTKQVWQLHEVLLNVPYDQIIIMVNNKKYGGGAIYNFYAVSSVHDMCGKIMPHELGHSIGGLADEYVDENLSYNDIHRTDIEPLEPNITSLVDFGSKWKDLVPEGTPIPTTPVKGLKPKENGPVGVYEGGGYQKKGIYRPVTNCMMNYYAEFCPVCSRRLQEVIKFYSK